MNADGKNVRRLTHHPAEDLSPAWSPNDQLIVFYAKWEGNRDIYLVDAAGGNRRRLTDHPAEDRDPAWVPPTFSLSVSPSAETQTTLWGRLKKPTLD